MGCINLLYKHEDAVRATEDSGRIAVAVVGAGALGDGDDELALGVGGGGHGGARAGREAEAPAVELEGGGGPVVVASSSGRSSLSAMSTWSTLDMSVAARSAFRATSAVYRAVSGIFIRE